MPGPNEDVVIAVGLYVLQVHDVISAREKKESQSLSCSTKDKNSPCPSLSAFINIRVIPQHQRLEFHENTKYCRICSRIMANDSSDCHTITDCLPCLYKTVDKKFCVQEELHVKDGKLC